MHRILLSFVLAVIASAAFADDEAFLNFSGDVFQAGSTIIHNEAGADDLFMAGEKVQVSADVTGSAHTIGRRVEIDAEVGGDVYAAGMDIAVVGDVRGDATLAGYDVVVSGVAGDLRVSGSKIRLNGPIGGYALVAGEDVQINAPIAGDVSVTAQDIAFGDDAVIGGTLTLYEKKIGQMNIPEGLVPADRVTRKELTEWQKDTERYRSVSFGGMVRSFLFGVVIITALAALIASLVPEHLAAMRRRILDAPFRTLWFGFITQSAVVGSAILFAMTLVGIVLSPGAIILALIGGFAGYIIGVYAFGVGLMLAIGRAEPETIAQRALAAGVGALVAGLLGLVPLLGWIFILALTLAGVGAITIRVFQPRFFAVP
ncbi:hypothetical protein [Actibacterium lipolyticum]|uniref:DUF8173 domain-containing protein n=1 Tax=Actibacterium lipolyticum TaxID=1524263 RepID=A0A238JLY5_9RHOB|nr:hypothetical protein [Actibacterium lipolyticum]SMX31679.1 hypothetical protein COL8621_00570 [Actibacterium lipolyticum]